jgi:hypothetical protein
MKTILFMKTFLLIACVTTLLTANGCLVEGGGGGHGHGEIHGGGAVMVPVPAVVVRPPEVIVR